MNPVLLKPETDTGAQIIVQGKRKARCGPRVIWTRRRPCCRRCWRALPTSARDADIVLVEGAGSPAEINLRAGDIANMGVCRGSRCTRGDAGGHRSRRRHCKPGRHASGFGAGRTRREFTASSSTSFVATSDCSIRARRRSPASRAGPRSACVPWLPQAAWLPAEDAVDLDRAATVVVDTRDCSAGSRRASPISTISIRSGMEPGVKLVFVRPGEPIPAEGRNRHSPRQQIHHRRSRLSCGRRAGTSTSRRMYDAAAMCSGLCGGYQMLGRTIADPDGVDGRAGTVEGLGLLDITTVMSISQIHHARQRGRHCATGAEVRRLRDSSWPQ